MILFLVALAVVVGLCVLMSEFIVIKGVKKKCEKPRK